MASMPWPLRRARRGYSTPNPIRIDIIDDSAAGDDESMMEVSLSHADKYDDTPASVGPPVRVTMQRSATLPYDRFARIIRYAESSSAPKETRQLHGRTGEQIASILASWWRDEGTRSVTIEVCTCRERMCDATFCPSPEEVQLTRSDYSRVYIGFAQHVSGAVKSVGKYEADQCVFVYGQSVRGCSYDTDDDTRVFDVYVFGLKHSNPHATLSGPPFASFQQWSRNCSVTILLADDRPSSPILDRLINSITRKRTATRSPLYRTQTK